MTNGTLPTPHVLGVRRRVVGPPDPHGNVTETLGDPVDWEVHGVAPGAMIEPGEPMRDASHVLWTVYAPNGGEIPGERDRVVYRGTEYDVDGHPKPYTDGPWAFDDAGVVVALKVVAG